MLELGRALKGKLLPMPKDMLTESVPGKPYLLRIKTEGIPDEEECARVLVTELYKRFKAKVVWIKIEDNVIELQIIGSPFPWAFLIAFIPTLLALIGIALIFLSVWNVIAAIPSWAWALLAVGGILILFGPSIGKMVAPAAEYFIPVEGK